MLNNMKNFNFSPKRELVDYIEAVNIIEDKNYPKPRWMLNNSVDDEVWILAKTAFPATIPGEDPQSVDKLEFKRSVSYGEYLTDPLWSPLLIDIRHSLLYLHLIGKISRPLRMRDILITTTYVIFHANELRHRTNKPPVRNLDQLTFNDLKHYLLSYKVSRQHLDAALEIIMHRWRAKSEIDWNELSHEFQMTLREFMSLKHKLILLLDSRFDNFQAQKNQFRKYQKANTKDFNSDIDLAPKEKTISNIISHLEALYVSRTAQLYKFQHSPIKLFSSGKTIFKHMLEPEKTPLMPVNVALHTISSALHFARNFGPPLLELVSQLNKTEQNKIKELGHSPSTIQARYSKEIKEYTFKHTSIPDALTSLNITSWLTETEETVSPNDKKGLSVCNAITLYCAAIWLLLASFSAGRSTSLLSLKRDCFRQSPIDGLFDLVLRIPKTSERFDLEEVHRPIPNLIHDYGLDFAALICELESRRNFFSQDSESYLFGAIIAERSMYANLYSGGEFYKAPLGLDSIYNAIDFFQDWSESPLIDGKRWYPTTHQFRRLFAVLYFNFSDSYGLDELSWFMGHADLDQTFHYAEVSPTDEWLEEAKLTIARTAAQLHKCIYSDETIQNIVSSARQESKISTVLEPLVHSMINDHIANTGEQVRFHKINGEDVFFYFSDKEES